MTRSPGAFDQGTKAAGLVLHHQPRLTTKQATKELESWLLETLPQRQNDRPPGPA